MFRTNFSTLQRPRDLMSQLVDAMTRLTISEETRTPERPKLRVSNKRKWEAVNPAAVRRRSDSLGPDSKRSRLDLNGECGEMVNPPFRILSPTRCSKQDFVQQKRPCKRTHEDVDPAGIRRRPDSPGPDSKRMRMTKHRSRKRRNACRVRCNNTGRSKATGGESIRVQPETLPLRIPQKAQKKPYYSRKSVAQSSSGTDEQSNRVQRVKQTLMKGQRKRAAQDEPLVVLQQKKQNTKREDRTGKGQGAEESRHPESSGHYVRKTFRQRRTKSGKGAHRRRSFNKGGKPRQKTNNTQSRRRFRPPHQMEPRGPQLGRRLNKQDLCLNLQDLRLNLQDLSLIQQDSRPKLQDSRPKLQDSRPNQQDSRPNQQDSRPKLQDSRPNQQDSRPNQQDSRPNQQDSRPNLQDLCLNLQDLRLN